MNDSARPWRPVTLTREENQKILTAGNETGWWDDNGRPAPWPDDFLDPECGWTNGNTTTPDDDDGDENDPENRPF
jgi:hypothetical protein